MYSFCVITKVVANPESLENLGKLRSLKIVTEKSLKMCYWVRTAETGWLRNTRSSADADKPARCVWRSVKVTIVPFHMLGIVSYCAIVTLSLRLAIFTIFDIEKCLNIFWWLKNNSCFNKKLNFFHFST